VDERLRQLETLPHSLRVGPSPSDSAPRPGRRSRGSRARAAGRRRAAIRPAARTTSPPRPHSSPQQHVVLWVVADTSSQTVRITSTAVPSTCTEPAAGVTKPSSARNSELFPAPLGPRRPMAPESKRTLTSASASVARSARSDVSTRKPMRPQGAAGDGWTRHAGARLRRATASCEELAVTQDSRIDTVRTGAVRVPPAPPKTSGRPLPEAPRTRVVARTYIAGIIGATVFLRRRRAFLRPAFCGCPSCGQPSCGYPSCGHPSSDGALLAGALLASGLLTPSLLATGALLPCWHLALPPSVRGTSFPRILVSRPVPPRAVLTARIAPPRRSCL